MSRIKASVLCWFVLLLLLLYPSDSRAQSQSTKQSDDEPTIQSLLNEVRLLRKTLQRTGLTSYRSQIIIERIRAHNEQVLRLTRTLEEVQNEIEKIEATISRLQEESKITETQIEQETDAIRRSQLELESKDGKRIVEQYKSKLERQREREVQITKQLRADQARLDELESRLESLEREIENEIERQRTEDASSGGKKRPQ
jgi:hypothetical protein